MKWLKAHFGLKTVSESVAVAALLCLQCVVQTGSSVYVSRPRKQPHSRDTDGEREAGQSQICIDRTGAFRKQWECLLLCYTDKKDQYGISLFYTKQMFQARFFKIFGDKKRQKVRP